MAIPREKTKRRDTVGQLLNEGGIHESSYLRKRGQAYSRLGLDDGFLLDVRMRVLSVLGDSGLVGGAASLLRLVAENRGAEA